MVTSTAGILIYGGTGWSVTNYTIQDKLNKNIEVFEDRCRGALDKINIEGNAKDEKWSSITAYDIGTKRWYDIFKMNLGKPGREDVTECFNMTTNPPFPPVTRDVRHSSTIYFMPTDGCDGDCNAQGQCTLSRCTCLNGIHGDACDKTNCPNSLCYVDIDTIEIQFCSHCSQNGKCNTTTGECACHDVDGVPTGYYGKDCSLHGCRNNCGNIPGQKPIGRCIQDYPFAYCKCFEENRRGGDDCSIVFCLNNCSGHGQCNTDGNCECDERWYGEDCSIRVLRIYAGSLYF